MSTRFMLARHATCAQTEHLLFGRTIDAPLDARGQRQALAFARRVARDRPTLVLSSPRRRALQTACAIAMSIARPLRADERLDELDFGHWAGKSFAALASDPDWLRWNRERGRAATPAGDDMTQVRQRLLGLLSDLRLVYPGQTIVLVTHAEVIRALVLQLLGQSDDDYAQVAIDPASLTVLDAASERLALERVNERPQLEERLSA